MSTRSLPCSQCRRTSGNLTIMPCDHAYHAGCINLLNGADAARPECVACHRTFSYIDAAAPGCQPCEPSEGELSRFFTNDYLTEASPVHGELMTESSNAEVPRGKVMGMAWWKNRLYVVYHKKSAVYVYSIQSIVPFRVNQTVHPAGIHWPRGIAVDSDTGYSYIIDWTRMFSGSLWRMDTNGTVEKIADVEIQPFGISLADNGNAIVVTCSTPLRAFLPAVGNSSKIIIFTPLGAIREMINLSNDLEIPRHALRIDRGSYSEYFVIHGWGHKRGQVVCVRSMPAGNESTVPQTQSSIGQIQSGCYGSTSRYSDQSLSKPLSLLDDGDNGILVVDYANHKIHLINSHLQFIQHILTAADNEINHPRHVCLDGRRGVLFVGFESGEIRAFHVKNPHPQRLNDVD